MKKEKLAFIINPISGSKSKAHIPMLIDQHLDKTKFDHQIIFTDYKGQGSELTNLAVANNTSVIVAVGGDGTVNEIAKVLLDTDVTLCIVPAGSGNGLARHLNISRNIVEAIKIINTGKTIKIDAGSVNNLVFFCTAGIGFDAHVGKVFANKTERGLKGYIISTIKEFYTYTPEKYNIAIEGKQIDKDAFLITFANASQYGNNAYIAPQAKISDGYLDVCIMKKFPFFFALDLAFKLFSKSLKNSRFIDYLKVKEIIISRRNPGVMHLDGEPMEMGNKLIVKILPLSLKVKVPVNYIQ